MSSGNDTPHFSKEEPDCANLIIRTNLSSPVPDVLAKLKVDQVLAIRYKNPRGPLTAETSKGETAGSIITGQQVNIINCIAKGYSFRANIIALKGGKCEIEIVAT